MSNLEIDRSLFSALTKFFVADWAQSTNKVTYKYQLTYQLNRIIILTGQKCVQNPKSERSDCNERESSKKMDQHTHTHKIIKKAFKNKCKTARKQARMSAHSEHTQTHCFKKIK